MCDGIKVGLNLKIAAPRWGLDLIRPHEKLGPRLILAASYVDTGKKSQMEVMENMNIVIQWISLIYE
jgi:hypothetical protein